MKTRNIRRWLTLEPLEPRTLQSTLFGGLLGMGMALQLHKPGVSPAELAGFPGVGDTGWLPPDPTAAAGPTSLVSMVNDHIALFSKSGANLAESAYLDPFGASAPFFGNVASTANGAFASDPWATYDRYSGRFVVAVEDLIPSGNNYQSYELIAISKSSSPTDLTSANWYTYAAPTTQVLHSAVSFADYMKLAADANNLYLTANYFSGNTFEGVAITKLAKGPMLSGSLGTITHIAAPGAASLQPVMSIGQSANAPEFFVDTWGSRGVRVWTLSSTNKLTAVAGLYAPFSTYNNGAPQLGTNLRLDTLSSRLMDAWWENGSIWTANTVAVGSQADVRWYQISTAGGPYRLVQEGTINPGAGVFTFMPAITVDGAGDMGITYTQSSTRQYASMMFTGRLASDPLNTTRPGVVVQAGVSPYTPLSDPIERWGDYSGIAVDPADNTTFWSFGEYAASSSGWGTWWGSFSIASLPPSLAQPAPLHFHSLGGTVTSHLFRVHVQVDPADFPVFLASSQVREIQG